MKQAWILETIDPDGDVTAISLFASEALAAKAADTAADAMYDVQGPYLEDRTEGEKGHIISEDGTTYEWYAEEIQGA